MIDHYSAVHKVYEVFYRKVYRNTKYEFIPSDKYLKYIEKFILLLDKRYKLETIGINFIINYFIFQFDYWTSLDIKSFNEKISLHFIIGVKAFNRWLERDSNFDYKLYNSDFLTKYKIVVNDIKDLFKEDEEDKLNIAEETDKKRFLNNEKGFLYCIERTTLFNHRSSVCVICNNKIDCKKLLINNYTRIAKSRGYV